MPVSSSSAGFGSLPYVVATATQLGSAAFRVTFSEVMASAGLTTIGNYTLTPIGPSVPRTISLVEIESPYTVKITTSGPLSMGTPAYSIVVAGVQDASGNALDVANDTAQLTVVGVGSNVVSREGGTIVNVDISPLLVGGRYKVRVGTTGTQADPPAFSTVVGEGQFRRLAPGGSGMTRIAVPENDVGTGLIVSFEAVDGTASPSTFTSPTTIDVYPKLFYSGVMSLRKLFPAYYDVGSSDPSDEALQ